MEILMGFFSDFLKRFRPRPRPPGPMEPFNAAEVIRLMNLQRLAAGLSKLHDLHENADLTDLARGWVRQMAAAEVLSHGDFHARISTKFPNTYAGEVIAAGQVSAKEVVDSWMGSSGHRAQILGTAYRKVGVAREVSSSRVPYWVADFAA
jgi:uncharacterized protein YkwD